MRKPVSQPVSMTMYPIGVPALHWGVCGKGAQYSLVFVKTRSTDAPLYCATPSNRSSLGFSKSGPNPPMLL